jgi:hypothetical protein
MPTYEVTAPDGRVFDVTAPDGASQAQVLAYAKSQFRKMPRQADNSTARGLALGAQKPLDNLTSAAMQIPGVAAVDQLGQRMGFPGAREAVASNDAARRANTATGAQLVGNIAGTLPTLALPGGALAQGAAGGALLSDATDVEGAAMDAGLGAVAGKAGDMAVRGVANVIAPKVSAAVRTLADEGIPLTPGQAFGGVTKGIEDRLSGFPVVGDLITSARSRGVEAFNANVINKALGNIGQKLPQGIKAGREAVAYAADAIGQAYDAIVPTLSVTGDRTFTGAIGRIERASRSLPGSGARDFKAVVGDDVLQQLKQGATLTGEGFKTLESRLSKFSGSLKSSSDAYQRMVGEQVDEVLGELRGLLLRSNPAKRAELAQLNRAFAEQVRIERAAGAAGNPTGVFTPKQYSAAVRASDGSARKSAIARGRGMNQGFADAASDVLPATVPDSGTAGRAATGLGVSALASGSLGVPLPAIAAAGAAAIPYTRAGSAALNALLRSPSAARQGASNAAAAGRYPVRVAVPALLARRDD